MMDQQAEMLAILREIRDLLAARDERDEQLTEEPPRRLIPKGGRRAA